MTRLSPHHVQLEKHPKGLIPSSLHTLHGLLNVLSTCPEKSAEAINVAQRPETRMEWDTMKDNIRGLYLEQNLPLKATIETMAERHSFFATERMYKRQFSRWNWRKYDSKGLRRSRLDGENIEMSHGEATCRRPLRRHHHAEMKSIYHGAQLQLQKQWNFPINLNHGCQDYQQSEGLFINLQHLINGSSEQEPLWNQTQRFSRLPKAADHLLRQVYLALYLFETCDFIKGGVILRQAFRDLELVVEETAVKIYQSLLLDIPHCLVSGSKEKELQTYLRHVSGILEIKKPGQPLTRIANTMYQISLRGLRGLQHYLAQMHVIVSDIYAQLRGENDFSTSKAYVEALRLGSQRNDSRRHSTIQRVEKMLNEAISHFGSASEEAMEIEFHLMDAGMMRQRRLGSLF